MLLYGWEGFLCYKNEKGCLLYFAEVAKVKFMAGGHCVIIDFHWGTRFSGFCTRSLGRVWMPYRRLTDLWLDLKKCKFKRLRSGCISVIGKEERVLFIPKGIKIPAKFEKSRRLFFRGQLPLPPPIPISEKRVSYHPDTLL